MPWECLVILTYSGAPGGKVVTGCIQDVRGLQWFPQPVSWFWRCSRPECGQQWSFLQSHQLKSVLIISGGWYKPDRDRLKAWCQLCKTRSIGLVIGWPCWAELSIYRSFLWAKLVSPRHQNVWDYFLLVGVCKQDLKNWLAQLCCFLLSYFIVQVCRWKITWTWTKEIDA